MIVHVFNSSIVSGPETLVIPALPKLGQPVQVIILTEARKGEEGRAPVEYARQFGLTVHEIIVRSRFDRGAIKTLRDLLEEIKPQILHAHDVKASAYTLWAVKKLKDCAPKLVSTHHGVRARRGWKIKLLEQFYVHCILPQYDGVLAVCSSDRELLIKRGLPEEKVFLHLNGVDRALIRPEEREGAATEVREKWGITNLGIKEGTLILGYAGRISSEKGLDRIFKVLKSLMEIEGVPEWVLLIFGKGNYEYPLKQLANDLGIAKHLRWMGYRQKLGSEMAGFDLLFSMSDAEGLPINLLEAAWAGTPVFCTAVDGICDLINWDEETALVSPTDPENKMAKRLAKMISDPHFIEQFAIKFQERVKDTFSGVQWLRNLTTIYSKIS